MLDFKREGVSKKVARLIIYMKLTYAFLKGQEGDYWGRERIFNYSPHPPFNDYDKRKQDSVGLGEAMLLLQLSVLLHQSVHAVDHALHKLHLRTQMTTNGYLFKK